ncbi:MAG: 23S rRNA (guanosine(2251)-2'-O)-methyltransferase RlmB [Acidobacteriota bacterium]|nr:23S rRNA (guanosine(2251)-2'-O)-methyltransferase RlmB [Acidobacteriota bacterium]
MSPKFKVQSSKSKVQSSKFKTEDRRPTTDERKSNSAIIFGVLPVLEALRAENRRIEKIVIAGGANENRLHEIFQLAKQNGVQFQKVPRENLSRIVADGANHQGVVAFVAAADYTDAEELLAEIFQKENSLSVILDGVEDPRNLGAILRTVECAGADGVFIPERRAASLTETVAKSSAGATEYVKVAKVANLNRLIDELKKHNIWVAGASGDAEMNYTDWDWTNSSALVLGGEGKGLHRLTAEKCDVLVKIPMQGKIESLNVSVAAGVVLFEAIKQRKRAKDKEQRTKD